MQQTQHALGLSRRRRPTRAFDPTGPPACAPSARPVTRRPAGLVTGRARMATLRALPQPPRSFMNPALQARVDALFADLADRAAPGLAIGILKDGERLLARGYGLASLEQQTRLRADSVLRIASVSKQFTVAAILLLERRGRLSRQDELGLHVPELAGLPLRLEQLMRNASGLPDLLELQRLSGVQLDQRVTRAELLAVMARCRHLNFEPGSRFLYSNSGFALLGLVAERVAGEPLGALLEREFFRPLGMNATRMLVESDLPLPGLATPYIGDGQGGWRRAQHGFEHGGEGGLTSTAEDLLLWAAHLLEPTEGVPDLAVELMARVPLAGGAASPYANGLEHSRLDGRLACVGHGGLWPGFRTEFLLLPQERLAVVVISNDGSGPNPYRVARELARLVLDLPAPPQPSAAQQQALCGTWLHAEAGQFFELAPAPGGRLLATQWGTPFELQAQADGSWLPLRGAYEFQLLGLQPDGRLALDIGAGERLLCARVEARTPLPAGLAGEYWSEDAATRWRIEPGADAACLQLWTEGPRLKLQEPWLLHGLAGELVELRASGYWMHNSWLLRPERDAAGAVSALCVDTARIKGLRLQRCG